MSRLRRPERWSRAYGGYDRRCILWLDGLFKKTDLKMAPATECAMSKVVYLTEASGAPLDVNAASRRQFVVSDRATPRKEMILS